MADQKITDLTEDTAPAATDLLLTVDNPGGSPANKKATISNVLNAMTMSNLPGYLGDNDNPDAYPGSANALDDEFDGAGAIDGKWTKVNDPAGADALNQTDFDGYLHVGLLELGTDTYDNTVRLYQTPPAYSSAWAVTAKVCLVAQGIATDHGEFAGVQLYLGNATNDQFIGAQSYINNGNGVYVPNLVASLADNGSGGFAGMSTNLEMVIAPGDWVWLKLEKTTTDAYTSANTYNAYASKNGLIWYQVGTISKTFTTACDEIGLMFRRPKSQTGTPKCEALVDSFRRTV